MKDISLAELEVGGFITKEIAEFCQSHCLYSNSSIVAFFLSEENAVEIEKIVLKTRNQLKDFCKQYLDQEIQNKSTIDLSIEQLAILENLSQRTINICNSTGLKSLSAIFQFKLINSGFLRIRN